MLFIFSEQSFLFLEFCDSVFCYAFFHPEQKYSKTRDILQIPYW
jgi:hypothetical protein